MAINFGAMSWWGKIGGALLGFVIKGPLGALIGAVIGHQFDVGLATRSAEPSGDHKTVQDAFFLTTFSVMGYVAKADGRVSENELDIARAVMQRLNLTEHKKREAIRLFNTGKQPDFPLDSVLDSFKMGCRGREDLVRAFVRIQLQAMLADRKSHPDSRHAIWSICQRLGLSRVEMAQLEAEARAGFGARDGLTDAYRVLGVTEAATDKEVKLAYRRLMNQHHPDKLVAKGLPAEMMELARDKTRAVREAYDAIRNARGMR